MLRQTQLQGGKTETIFNNQSDGRTHLDARNPKYAKQTRTYFFEPRNSTFLRGHTQDIEKHVLLSAMYPECWEFCFHFLRFFFFWCGPLFKVFIEFVTMVLLLFMFWIFGHEACETLVPQSGDQTHTACIGRWSVNHWSAKKSRVLFFLTFYFVLGYSQLTHNVMTVSGEQRRDPAIHTQASLLP